jgi:1,4-alpha-glucan branching enzyme
MAGTDPAPGASGAGDETRRIAELLSGRSVTPHDVLGAHAATRAGGPGVLVRALHPDARTAACLVGAADGTPRAVEMKQSASGLFEAFLPGATLPLRYRLRFDFADGETWERGDPYRFLPTLGDVDLHLLGEGTHRRPWECLGSRVRTIDGETGASFAVWAPTARRVSVVGDFCGWDGRLLPMRALGSSGIHEIFVPGVAPGALYKYEILTQQDALRLKTDPFALELEPPPASASRVAAPNAHAWGDAEWMARRRTRDWRREPMLIYEIHLGSWMRVPEEGDRSLTYREIAPRLAEHVASLGFTHVQFMPVMEHPFDGSWGYQVTGYYAPTSRFGSPDDFRFLVDTLHRAGIGVLLDWVPAHFPRDDFALRRFDGSALYEHEDPRLGEHQDWGTLIFNYGRPEVRNFLVGSALSWIERFHVDGLRVDAVASMLYLDYSRKPGDWLPNRWGGRENVDAIHFLRQLNDAVHEEQAGAIVVAEESTSFAGVTRPTGAGGLGFDFKWNMGWMHDTLGYFARDPLWRRWHQDELTFAMLYQYSEHFVDPISHDEVVYGKGSLFGKMPGDDWQKFANLRALLAYQWTRPGKVLQFMGFEIASPNEWNHASSLDWHLESDPLRRGLRRWIERLGRLYRASPALWRGDPDPEGFRWIDCSDRDQSVVAYLRRDPEPRPDAPDHLVVVLNLTPEPRIGYRVGVPGATGYVEVLDGDAAEFGGSGHPTRTRLESEPVPFHGFEHSVQLVLPPLAALVLAPAL